MRARVTKVLAVALAAAASLFAIPGQSGAASHQAAVAPPLPTVQSVTDLGNVTENPVIYARDGIMSGIWNGQSIWTFGDTPMSVPGADGDNWANNTLSWTSDLNASDGINLNHDVVDSTNAPTEYIPMTKAERTYNARHEGDPCQAKPCNTEFAIWSGPVIPDPARNRILLPYTEINRTIGSLGWRTVGGGIAVWTPGGKVVRPIASPGTAFPTLMWQGDDIQYNAAWVAEGQTLYLYGEQLEFLSQHYLVARVQFADVLDESKWQYYTAAGTWSSNKDDAAGVFDGGAAGSTVFYNPYVGAYMAIYSAIFSNNVMYRVGSTPYGPWSNEALAFVGRTGWNGNTNYAGEAHPEYAQGNGQTQYVTYFHTTGFLRGDIPLVKVVFGPPA